MKRRIFSITLAIIMVFTGIGIGGLSPMRAAALTNQNIVFLSTKQPESPRYTVTDREESNEYDIWIPDVVTQMLFFNVENKTIDDKVTFQLENGKEKNFSTIAATMSSKPVGKTLKITINDNIYTYHIKQCASLNNLSVEGKEITPSYQWSCNEYTVAAASKKETITIKAEPKNAANKAIKIAEKEANIENGVASAEIDLSAAVWEDDKTIIPIEITDSSLEKGSTYQMAIIYNPKVQITGQSDNSDKSYYDNEINPTEMSVTAAAPTEISYQWYAAGEADLKDAKAIVGAVTEKYKPQIDRLGEVSSETSYYYCEAKNTVEETTYTAKSKPWKVTVNKGIYPSVELTQEDGTAIPDEGYFIDASTTDNTPIIKANVGLPDGYTADQGIITYKWCQEEDEFGTELGNSQTFSQGTYDDAVSNYYCFVSFDYNGTKFTTKSRSVRIATFGFSKDYLTYTPNQYGYADKTTKVGKSIKIGVTVSCSLNGQLYYQWFTSKDGKEYTPINELEQSLTLGGYLDNNITLDTPVKSVADESNYYCKVVYQRESKAKPGEIVKTELTTVPVKVTTEGLESVSGFEGKGTKDNPYLIKKIADLQHLRKLVNEDDISCYERYFRFEEDIIIPKADWTPIGTENNFFMGHINGNNKTLTVEKDGKPLLGYVRDASVSNLNIQGEKINGYGLVDNYVVDRASTETIRISNVTIKTGTNIVKSGFIGGYASGVNNVYITNCKIEKGVVIGCDKDQDNIGGFAGEFNGFIINCTNEGDVYGRNYVGGIIADKGQCMGFCSIRNSVFSGRVVATGNYAGGISGAGYGGTVYGVDSAPNTPCITIQNCISKGEISGKNYVGGILGAEPGVVQCWDNGIGYITDNLFVGKISATELDPYIGGIAGYINAINKYNIISNNYFSDSCGAEKGIGHILLIDTNNPNADKSDNTVKYINTSGYANYSEMKLAMKALGFTGVEKVNYNRTDDPLGADAEKLCKAVTENELKDNTVVDLLNSSASSFKNWEQDDNYPTHSKRPVIYALELSGNYRITYKTGEKLDTTGMIITAYYSDGTTTTIRQGDENDKRFQDVKFTGFNSNKRGVQTITVTYGVAKTTYDVTVLYNSSQVRDVFVYFTLLGDTKHGEPTEATGTHTLKDNNLDKWVRRTEVPINNNNTVYDVMKKVFNANGITWEESNKRGTVYIESLTRNGVTLGEFTNGNLSGWMYTLNGKHPSLGVAQQYLNGGEEIVFHYTDDYTVEQGSEDWNTPGGGTVEEVNSVTTDTKVGTTTAPTDVKISEKTNADGTKEKVADVKVSADNQKEILKQVKEKKSNEIILVVSSKSVGDATKADVMLEKSFIDSIVKDTDAKLTIRTPFGDKTYTQEELKAMSDAATGSTITVTIEKTAEPADDAAANIAKAKSIVKDMKLVARSSKTAKKNIKAVLKSDAKVKASIKELKDLGFTVKYRFYRSTKKAASYKSTVTKKAATYTNTAGKKGTKYFYKLQVRVYDENGKLVAKTALKQCKYASRVWSK